MLNKTVLNKTVPRSTTLKKPALSLAWGGRTTAKTAFALGCAFGLLLSACGGEGDGSADPADRDAVIAWLVDQGETTESANCFADELPGYDVTDFEKFEAAEDADDLDSDFGIAVITASQVCSDK